MSPTTPPPEGEHGAIAAEAVRDQHIEHACRIGEGLVCLTIGEQDLDDTALTQACAQRAQVQRSHGCVADDEHVARREGGEARRTLEQPGIDEDRVPAGSEFDVQSIHFGSHDAAASAKSGLSIRERPRGRG